MQFGRELREISPSLYFFNYFWLHWVCCWAWAFSSCSEWGLLSSCRARAPEHRLSSCGAWAQLPTACRIVPDQGLNPCPLHWQEDFQPLDDQESYSVFMHAQSFSHVQFFATPWTVVCQAPQSMGYSRQDDWSGLSFSPPGDLL